MQLNEVLAQFKESSCDLDQRKLLLKGLLAPSTGPVTPQSLKKKLKRAIKGLAPVQYLLKRRYDRDFATLQRANLFRGVFPDFAGASASAPDTKVIGYDHQAPAGMYRDHVDHLYPMDYPALLWMGAILNQSRSVFDFGGHIGVAYYSFSRYLEYPEGMRWKVFDVPAVIEAGRRFAKDRSDPGVSFTNDLSDAEGFDVFYGAGSLQYSEEWLPDLLRKIRAAPSHVLINKLPVTQGPGCVTLQSIGTAFCPYRIFNEDDWLEGMAAAGYRLVDAWKTPDLRCEIPFFPGYSDIRYHGYYFKKAAVDA